MKTIAKGDKDLTICIHPEEEHIPIKGNALASGDEAADRECEEEIARDLDSGNPWAWCCVRVSVTYRGILSANAYLGCCSYSNEKEFREEGDFDQMVDECIDTLNSKLKALAE